MKYTIISVYLLLLFWHIFASANDDLVVFYPSVQSARERQDSISEEGIANTVFAQYRDFEETIIKNNSQLIIAPYSFTQFKKDYSPIGRFTINGENKIQYLLLSTSDKWTPQNLKEARIGVIEELNKNYYKEYLKLILNTEFKLTKMVTKPEDIFPLLVFKAVDVILLSATNYEELKKKYSVNVHIIVKTAPIDNPTIFVKNKESVELQIKKIFNLKKSTLKILGFDGIENIGASK